MQHSFDISIASNYGINAALFLNNIAFWIQKNLANGKHYNDGYHWTYNSQEAFLKLFPYWTRQNLRTTINKCVDEGLIKLGNYNEKKYDRTGWYALTELGLTLFPLLKSLGCNQPMESLKPTTPLVRTNQPIPDSKPDNKTDRESAERKKRVPLPDNFQPNDEAIQLAKQKDLDLFRAFTKFKAHAKSENWRRIDWNAALMKWLLDERINQKIIKNEPYSAVNRMKEFVSDRNMTKGYP